MSIDEIAALINIICEPTSKGKRDAALIVILRGTGLRRAEVANLELKDFDLETGGLAVRQGKGGKNRMVYLPETAFPYIEAWLEVRGDLSGGLLCPVRRGGKIENRHLTPQAVGFCHSGRNKRAWKSLVPMIFAGRFAVIYSMLEWISSRCKN